MRSAPGRSWSARLGPLGRAALATLLTAAVLAGCGGGGDKSSAGGGEGTGVAIGTGPCSADQRADDGQGHVTAPTYTVDPPAGGPHLAVAAPPGVYDEAPPDGNLVHSMEHGYVVLWHRPDAGPDVDEVVATLAKQFTRELLVVPRPAMSVPVAMTAWHERLLCEQPDQAQLTAFVRAYRDKGPETGFL